MPNGVDLNLEEEEDDEIAGAMRRDAEMDRDPSMGMTLEGLKASLGR